MGWVEKHSQMKHRLLGMYLSICARNVKSTRNHDFVIVDLYANDGMSQWYDGDEQWEGSAQIAAKWASNAGTRSYCVFNEKNSNLIESLKQNTKNYSSSIKTIFNEDANEIYQKILCEYIPRDSHSIFILDPYRHTDLKFSTVKSIAKHCQNDYYKDISFVRRPEQIINLPTFTILKSKTQNEELITDFFGTDEWIEAVKIAEKNRSSQPKALLDVYKNQLEQFYPSKGIVPIEIRTIEYNAPIYYLLFVATHPLAIKIHNTFERWVNKKIKEFRREGYNLKLIAEARRKNLQSLDKWIT